ncbi:MAG TPA: type II toxin-antitoxin system RelE/ParE family toxin [Kofleriaceae bacterium]|jgi:plasmid stabilization system protein ParE|nr:type II toxin-antitoxin system RelE/ParE family toxin [Kofleriaceae bacterium]
MRWKLSTQAKLDLRRVVYRIRADNPRAAAQWLIKFRDRARLAGRSPRLGRKVPELDRDDIREAIVGNYRMVYVIRPKVVEVLGVFEGHKLLPDLDNE